MKNISILRCCEMRKDISTEILQSWWTGCLISEDFFVKTFNHKKKDLKHWKFFPFAGFPFQFSGVRRWRNPLKLKKKSYVLRIRVCIKLWFRHRPHKVSWLPPGAGWNLPDNSIEYLYHDSRYWLPSPSSEQPVVYQDVEGPSSILADDCSELSSHMRC